jgi:hypothetical protein
MHETCHAQDPKYICKSRIAAFARADIAAYADRHEEQEERAQSRREALHR